MVAVEVLFYSPSSGDYHAEREYHKDTVVLCEAFVNDEWLIFSYRMMRQSIRTGRYSAHLNCLCGCQNDH